jgi:DnaJ-class molecular chaperone
MTDLVALPLVLEQWNFLTRNSSVEDLFRLIKFSVPYSHPNYNRRYKNLGMYIEDRIIHELGDLDVEGELDIFQDAMKCVTCHGTCHTVDVLTCVDCQGQGCSTCTWSGESLIYSPCAKYNKGEGIYE